MCKEIKLSQGFVTIVDDDNFGLLNRWKWFAKFGGTGGRPYAARSIKVNTQVKTIRLHRLITNAPSGTEVDHRNGDTLDNRRENLGVVSKAENLSNRYSNKTPERSQKP